MDDCHVSNMTNLKEKSTLAGLTLIILFVEMLNPNLFFVANLDHLATKKTKSECDFHKWVFFWGKMGTK
jgi:hypothetical protein